MLPIIALTLAQASDNIRLNEFSPNMLGGLLQIAYMLGNVGVGGLITWALMRRKPSPEATFANNDQRLVNMEGSVRLLFKKVDQIMDSITELKTGQGKNSVNIDDIKTTVHLMQAAVKDLNDRQFKLANRE